MSSAKQEIPWILWNPKVLPHSQEPATCPCPEPDRSSLCPLSHISRIHFNIILPSTPGPSTLRPSLRFPHQNLVCTSPFPHTCSTPCTSVFWFDHTNNLRWGVQSKSSLLCSLLHSPRYLVLLRSKYPPQHPILENPQPTFLPQCERRRFTLI